MTVLDLNPRLEAIRRRREAERAMVFIAPVVSSLSLQLSAALLPFRLLRLYGTILIAVADAADARRRSLID